MNILRFEMQLTPQPFKPWRVSILPNLSLNPFITPDVSQADSNDPTTSINFVTFQQTNPHVKDPFLLRSFPMAHLHCIRHRLEIHRRRCTHLAWTSTLIYLFEHRYKSPTPQHLERVPFRTSILKYLSSRNLFNGYFTWQLAAF